MSSLRLLFICAAACSGGHTAGFGPVKVEDVTMDEKKAACEYETRCGVSPDVDTCMSANLGIGLGFDDDMSNAIAAGKVTYDSAKYGQCLDAFAAESCDRTSESARYLPDICAEAIKGTVPLNGACELDAECISQSCVLVPPCPSACCTGTCGGNELKRDIVIGMPCNGGTCVAGAYCNGGGFCASLKPGGAACAADYECGYGLACSMTSSTCASLPGPGQPCPDRRCRDVGTHCDAGGTCVKDGLPGDSCTATLDCAPLLYAGIGATLAYGHAVDGAAHFICATNQCAIGPEPGAICSSTAPCFEEATFCDATSTCVSLLADGSACADDGQCNSGYCNTNLPGSITCMPRSCF